MEIIKVRDRSHLISIIENSSRYADLNHLDVSGVTDMSKLFYQNKLYRGDISKWDVSNVTDMREMFRESNYMGDLSNWDVSRVTDMSFMFCESIFNQDISRWNVFGVRSMESMFEESAFNKDISSWVVSPTTQLTKMFYNSAFNQNISNWRVAENESTWMFLRSKYMYRYPRLSTMNDSLDQMNLPRLPRRVLSMLADLLILGDFPRQPFGSKDLVSLSVTAIVLSTIMMGFSAAIYAIFT